MPMQIFRRAVIGLMALGLTLSALAILSCGGSDEDNETRLQANLSAANEIPSPPRQTRQATARQY